MNRENCRYLATILLPKGADDKEAFKNVPKQALMTGEYLDDDSLLDAENMATLGNFTAMTVHRAVKAGRGELN